MRSLLLLILVAASGSQAPSPELIRQLVAETALAQVKRIDPGWQPEQRDCAGLVRFAFRAAFKRAWPQRLGAPLWKTGAGTPTDFADAETLVASNFAPLGRGEDARSQLQSGDLGAFRNTGAQGQPVFHLML